MNRLEARVTAFMKRVWVLGDIDAAHEMMAADAVTSGLEAETLEGPSDYLRYHRMIARQFDNIAYRTLQAVENDNWVAIMGEMSGVEIRSGRRVCVRLHYMMRFEDDLITEISSLVDFLSLFEQVGRLPPRTLDLCLMEQRLEVQPRTERAS
ncbi:ester cyclase [Puniceibacterium sp. IMCC21224]|uniref:ester cyclase n=1 Tax=Puniceibacterium sp. IMCC21224 TaxID=1618204 RepID=UPI00065CD37D|nr:nuclear transport factor 2 family protein [Puniceibacterium sp. IMCC21224]KMK67945.1 SnoaL-like domain [Puniceibacterium sp. IMCC21224]